MAYTEKQLMEGIRRANAVNDFAAAAAFEQERSKLATARMAKEKAADDSARKAALAASRASFPKGALGGAEDIAGGLLEVPYSIASGIGSMGVGGAAGLANALYNHPGALPHASPKETEAAMRDFMQAYEPIVNEGTYQPRTYTGQHLMDLLGLPQSYIDKIARKATQSTTEATGSVGAGAATGVAVGDALQGLLSALTGGAGRAAGGAISRLPRTHPLRIALDRYARIPKPAVDPNARAMHERGGDLTIGQMLRSRWAKTTEEKLESHPFVGSQIEHARNRGVESYQRMTLNAALPYVSGRRRPEPPEPPPAPPPYTPPGGRPPPAGARPPPPPGGGQPPPAPAPAAPAGLPPPPYHPPGALPPPAPPWSHPGQAAWRARAQAPIPPAAPEAPRPAPAVPGELAARLRQAQRPREAGMGAPPPGVEEGQLPPAGLLKYTRHSRLTPRVLTGEEADAYARAYPGAAGAWAHNLDTEQLSRTMALQNLAMQIAHARTPGARRRLMAEAKWLERLDVRLKQAKANRIGSYEGQPQLDENEKAQLAKMMALLGRSAQGDGPAGVHNPTPRIIQDYLKTATPKAPKAPATPAADAADVFAALLKRKAPKLPSEGGGPPPIPPGAASLMGGEERADPFNFLANVRRILGVPEGLGATARGGGARGTPPPRPPPRGAPRGHPGLIHGAVQVPAHLTGHEAVHWTRRRINAAFERAVNAVHGNYDSRPPPTPGGPPPQSLRDEVTSLRGMVSAPGAFTDPAAQARALATLDLMDQTLGPGRIAGRTLQTLVERLNTEQRFLGRHNDPEMRNVAQMIHQLQDGITRMIYRDNTRAQAQNYARARHAWSIYLPAEAASVHGGVATGAATVNPAISIGGVPSAARYLTAVRQHDPSRRHTRFAQGTGGPTIQRASGRGSAVPLQTMAEQGRAVYGNRYRDSGTPGRHSLLDVLKHPLAAIPGMTEAIPGHFLYSDRWRPRVQAWLMTPQGRSFMARNPHFVRNLTIAGALAPLGVKAQQEGRQGLTPDAATVDAIMKAIQPGGETSLTPHERAQVDQVLKAIQP